MRSELERTLQALATALEPEPAAVAEAEKRAHTLIRELHRKDDAWMFSVVDTVSHGSHSRGTAIHLFKDIDYLVVLDEGSLRTRQGGQRTAQDTVTRLARAIEERRAGLVSRGLVEVRRQEHSVGVKYPNSGYRVDLVPALRTRRAGEFLIPDRTSGRWIHTCPERLRDRLALAERANPHVRPAIRLLKGWRRARGKAMQFPSYGLELLATELATQAPPTLEGLVLAFLETFAHHDLRYRLTLLGEGGSRPVNLLDPATNVNVTEELGPTHRKRLVDNARTALDALGEAASGSRRGRSAETVCRKLFVGERWG